MLVRMLFILVHALPVFLAIVGLVVFLITVIYSGNTKTQVNQAQSQLSTEVREESAVREETVEEVQEPEVVEEERSDKFLCPYCPDRCSEYTSCDFAMFCAFQCGLALDGDDDGVPCEGIVCPLQN